MPYRDRLVTELKRVYTQIDNPNKVEVALTSDGDIDLTKVNIPALVVAQGRVLGAMLDALLAPKRAAKKPAPKAKKAAHKPKSRSSVRKR